MKLLTLARDLQRRKARERLDLFVAEGVRAAEELLRSPLAPRGLLVSPGLVHAARGSALLTAAYGRGIPVEEVSDRDFDTASDTESPQGVLAIAEIPRGCLESLVLPERARVVVLDSLQDPGNVGTILRTAAAFGVAVTVALPGTVDLWNAKVVRSAMGALFHRPATTTTWEELDRFLASTGTALWGTDRSGVPLEQLAAPPRLALALGNEGGGHSPAARMRIAHSVSISIGSDVDSLNVAVAAGILLHHFRL